MKFRGFLHSFGLRVRLFHYSESAGPTKRFPVFHPDEAWITSGPLDLANQSSDAVS
jgi:hypothetical protein